MGLHEIKTFCTTKEMFYKLKRLPTEWEKMFDCYMSDEINNQNIQGASKLNSKDINDSKKWANETEHSLFKGRSANDENTHEEIPSLAINEIQIKTTLSKKQTNKKQQKKTTLRFHLIPVRIASIKNTNNNKCWRGCGKKEPSYTACGNAS
jgi:hypothetical protein